MEKIDVDKLLADGWKLRDIPLTTEQHFHKILDKLGKDIIVLAASRIKRDGQVSMRGQTLISPNGFMKLLFWRKELRDG